MDVAPQAVNTSQRGRKAKPSSQVAPTLEPIDVLAPPPVKKRKSRKTQSAAASASQERSHAPDSIKHLKVDEWSEVTSFQILDSVILSCSSEQSLILTNSVNRLFRECQLWVYLQMDIGKKAYWVQSVQHQLAFLCPAVDVTLLQTSKDTGVLGNTAKINPFNDEKGQTIKESFSIGKLDFATVIITTNPPSPLLEEEAFGHFKLQKNAMLLSEALVGCKKVRIYRQTVFLISCFPLMCKPLPRSNHVIVNSPVHKLACLCCRGPRQATFS